MLSNVKRWWGHVQELEGAAAVFYFMGLKIRAIVYAVLFGWLLPAWLPDILRLGVALIAGVVLTVAVGVWRLRRVLKEDW